MEGLAAGYAKAYPAFFLKKSCCLKTQRQLVGAYLDVFAHEQWAKMVKERKLSSN